MTDITVIEPPEDRIMSNHQVQSDTDIISCVETDLSNLSTIIRGFCPGEISDLGRMLNILNALAGRAKNAFPDSFMDVASGCIRYIENMILENIEEINPVEEGLILLNAIIRHVKKGAQFGFDTSDVIRKLNSPFPGTPADSTDNPLGTICKSEEMETLSEQDTEILIDFTLEAEENLEKIEVRLIDLEQNPSDLQILNDIFRPFHTIKGVSGFLSLEKINHLSHATETFLDSARSGEFIINDVATDTILESVDTMRRLISSVKNGIAQGVRQKDDDIDILRLKSRFQTLRDSLCGSVHEPIGEILIRKGVIDRETLDRSLAFQEKNPEKKTGEILINENKVDKKEVSAALKEQKNTIGSISNHVKVSTSKLDDLVDYAGELVIAQSMVRQKASADASLYQSVLHLGQIVNRMQGIAMSMRMTPIKSTFMKMIRLVRDLSQKSGKRLTLEMKGEDTEIDRNVVEALYEPMVHMIRNSVDHGIEPLIERREMGKPDTGQITLRAYHKGGDIIIEIEDDGKGLDTGKILEKAIGTGLVSKDEILTDTQIYNLILKPGFSTASQITDISGRGVGMDVVKDSIEKFRGHIGISSTLGKGTCFTISLPLTMAIIDGMLVRVGTEKYVIPTTAVKRAFRPEERDCFSVQGRGEMIKQGGRLIPLIRLKQLYAMEDDTMPPWESLVVVVESKDEQKGLIIDELIGKDEFVIKSLGESLENSTCFSGGAILSDGRVGLILDIQGVFQQSLYFNTAGRYDQKHVSCG